MSINQYKIKPYNNIFTIYKIPFSQIEKVNVSLKDKNKSYPLKKHCDEQSWDIGVNGCMFDMRTYQNVTDLIVNGVVNNGGNYSNVGLAFGNDFSNIGAYKSTTSNSNGKMVDFIGGAPTIIMDSKINIDMKGIENGFQTRLTQRTVIGIDKNNVYILSTLKNKSNLTSIANELIAHGCIHAIDLDGGGSTAIKAGDFYFTQGRNIPTAFGIKLKNTNNIAPTTPTASKPSLKVALDSGHSKVVSGKRSVDSTLLEYEFNMDISKRIQNHLKRHNVDSIIVQVENTNLKQELNKRIELINAYNPDISVSIHANAHGNGKEWTPANGWEIYHSKGSTNGLKLAQAIHSESIPYLGLIDRGIKETSVLAMVRRPKAPSILIEHGFMTNKSDCENLKSNEHREKFAIADTKGILKYLGIKWIEPKEEQNSTEINKEIKDEYIHKVQLGAFKNEENAQKLQKELETKGYKTIISKVKI